MELNMLDFRADAGLHLLRTLSQELGFDELVELASLACAHRHVPGRPLRFSSLVYTLVVSVPKGRMLLAVQQRTSHVDVTHVGWRAHHRMYEARLRVHTDVRLHAEVPLVSLLGLMHLGIARAVRVLGRAGRRDDGCVHDGAGTHQKSLFGKVGVDLLEQRLGEVVVQQQLNLQSSNEVLKGRLRVVALYFFSRVTLVPALAEFAHRYPKLTLELETSDRPVDLIEGGFDLAIRTGAQTDSRLVAKLLMRVPYMAVASPNYLHEHGIPKDPADLAEHNCLVGRFGPDWHFHDTSGRELKIRVSGSLTIFSGDVLREADVVGLGIANHNRALFRKDLDAGSLVPVLSDFIAGHAPYTLCIKTLALCHPGLGMVFKTPPRRER